MIIKVVTLGCKVNQCESASIVAALIKNGYNASEGLSFSDVYVLNTCSVTAEADRKSRQYLTKMRKLNANCKIIVVGCSSQNRAEKFIADNVIAIGGTHEKVNFVSNALKKLQQNNDYSILSDIIPYENIYDSAKIGEYCYEDHPKFDRTRTFVKIQDGCNRFCTYCIIPYLRGRSRSRSVDDILSECEMIESEEIVLTGIDMSSYGKDIGVTFPELLKRLSVCKARKRIGSLECEVVDDELLTAMRDGGYCPHFHLSLQSGSNDVLRTMNRKYDTEYYYDKVSLIRRYFPLAGITTDIIVGFPTETAELFEESLDFVKKCAFSDIHVFPYSSRSGTLAAKKYDMLDKNIVAERVKRMLDVKRASHEAFLQKNLGKTYEVYSEINQGVYNVGYTPNYIKVYSAVDCGTLGNVTLIEPYLDGVIGK